MSNKKECRICSHIVEPFIDFGDMPMGNAFLDRKQVKNEYLYHMRVAVCPKCKTLQLMDIPKPEQMFHDHYAYYASTSEYMKKHFKQMSNDLIKNFSLNNKSFVVEIGSNDGITLKNFAEAGIPHLGVDPSSNVANVAKNNGVDVLCDFFGSNTADTIVANKGNADLFIATNTMHHIEDINSVAEGVSKLLSPRGVMVSEDPYLGDMIESTAYDQLYAEHMYIWSITSMNNVFSRYDMEVFDVEKTPYHGGCMRYYLSHKGSYDHTDRLLEQKNNEKSIGIGDMNTYHDFRLRCEESRKNLTNLIKSIKSKGKTIVGYGATAKSATVINYCGISPKDLEYISDTTPIKQNKLSPGAHIPIVDHSSFSDKHPDYAILFAWNHIDEINKKEVEYRNGGGKWVIPVRMVEVL
ncbi:MAG: class I SAM-dependent methyltransferase [Flavobacteriales bacterium]|jgi:methylation protein EvaC|nr:class I SAM-dependent methyltransferase [Flavobacteriales bacterium]